MLGGKSLSSNGYVCHEHETSYSRHNVTLNSTCKSGDEMYTRCRQVYHWTNGSPCSTKARASPVYINVIVYLRIFHQPLQCQI